MAKERRNGSLGYAETMLQIYNKRTKYRLDYSKLYDSRTKRYMQLLDESEASEDSDEDIAESGEDQGNLEELNESEAAGEKDSLQTT